MSKFSGFLGNYIGLNDEQVISNQTRYGKNVLVNVKKENLFLRLISILKEPMFVLLFVTSLTYFLLKEPQDGLAMLVSVFFVAGINLWQEFKTEKALQALKSISEAKVRIIRNEKLKMISSSEVTIGDLIIIQEGDKIQADGKILEINGFGVNESVLTGESMVVWKTKIDNNTESFWKINICYAGTSVSNGSAIYEVTAIGTKSEYGKIGLSLSNIKYEPTNLEKGIKKIVKVATIISAILFVATFGFSLLQTNNIVESLLRAITLAMAMIPEEFPVILTIFLAVGATRLAKNNSLIRKLNSVETLGSISVLCVDKTGTLTRNEMNIEEVYCYESVSKNDLLYTSVLASESHPIDPMEIAIHHYAEKSDLGIKSIYQNNLIHEYPFSSENRMMGHIWQIDNNKVLTVKGAFESVITLCGLSEKDVTQLNITSKELSHRGYRVLAIAQSILGDNIPLKITDNKLQFLGLLAMTDPPREGVLESIKESISAGIRVIMITGDNGNTARAIADRLGFANTNEIITGHLLDDMSDSELAEKVKTTNIFARVIPTQKLKIVKALKKNGEIVAMTGDGVNDAPALKFADIGVAMGKRGTEVAKEASDMILLDDNFKTIVDSIKDGRRIYANIKKAISYVFIIHIPIALLALFTPILNLPILLLPIHIVILELIIDPTCSIIFERTPAEKDIMNQKPRNPNEPLLSIRLLTSSIIQGLSIFIASIFTYYYLTSNSWVTEEARAVVVFILVFSNLLLVYTKKSYTDITLISLLKTKDLVVNGINIGILGIVLFFNFTSWGNNLLKIGNLSLEEITKCLLIAVIAVCWVDAWKVYKLLKK